MTVANRGPSFLLALLVHGCTTFGEASAPPDAAPPADAGTPGNPTDGAVPEGATPSRFCDGYKSALRCFDFEGPESAVELFPTGPTAGALAVQLEGNGNGNHVLRARNVEDIAAVTIGETAKRPYELRFRFRVEAWSGKYCVIGSFFQAFGDTAGGGRADGVSVYGGGQVGPNDARGQTTINGSPNWRKAVVTLSGSPLVSRLTVDGSTFNPVSYETSTESVFQLRFGAFYCSDVTASVFAFDDIVLEQL